MKKLVFLLGVIALTATPMFAQGTSTTAGSMEISAGKVFGYTMRTGDGIDPSKTTNPVDKTEYSFGIGSMQYGLGFFVIDNLAVGGMFDYTSSKAKDASESSATWEAIPYVKFYIPVNEQFLIDVKGQLGYLSEKTAGYSDKTTQLYLGIGAGATYLVTSSLGLNFDFDYLSFNQSKTGSVSGKDAHGDFVFSLGATAYLGFGSM
jgi:hypothetical protein